MISSRPSCPLACPSQYELDTLRGLGINVMSLATPIAMQAAVGAIAHDGLFEPAVSGDRWFAFPQPGAVDIVFWHLRSGRITTWAARSFALGEDVIDNPGTYAFDCCLNIFKDPITWLQSKRDGIVVLPRQWPLAFDRLRDAPRIAIAEPLLPFYRRHMKPIRMPELMIIPERRRAA